MQLNTMTTKEVLIERIQELQAERDRLLPVIEAAKALVDLHSDLLVLSSLSQTYIRLQPKISALEDALTAMEKPPANK